MYIIVTIPVTVHFVVLDESRGGEQKCSPPRCLRCLLPASASASIPPQVSSGRHSESGGRHEAMRAQPAHHRDVWGCGGGGGRKPPYKRWMRACVASRRRCPREPPWSVIFFHPWQVLLSSYHLHFVVSILWYRAGSVTTFVLYLYPKSSVLPFYHSSHRASPSYLLKTFSFFSSFFSFFFVGRGRQIFIWLYSNNLYSKQM